MPFPPASHGGVCGAQKSGANTAPFAAYNPAPRALRGDSERSLDRQRTRATERLNKMLQDPQLRAEKALGTSVKEMGPWIPVPETPQTPPTPAPVTSGVAQVKGPWALSPPRGMLLIGAGGASGQQRSSSTPREGPLPASLRPPIARQTVPRPRSTRKVKSACRNTVATPPAGSSAQSDSPCAMRDLSLSRPRTSYLTTTRNSAAAERSRKGPCQRSRSSQPGIAARRFSSASSAPVVAAIAAASAKLAAMAASTTPAVVPTRSRAASQQRPLPKSQQVAHEIRPDLAELARQWQAMHHQRQVTVPERQAVSTPVNVSSPIQVTPPRSPIWDSPQPEAPELSIGSAQQANVADIRVAEHFSIADTPEVASAASLAKASTVEPQALEFQDVVQSLDAVVLSLRQVIGQAVVALPLGKAEKLSSPASCKTPHRLGELMDQAADDVAALSTTLEESSSCTGCDPPLTPEAALAKENEVLRTALGDAKRRLKELEGEEEGFMCEGAFDLVNSLCRDREFQNICGIGGA